MLFEQCDLFVCSRVGDKAVLVLGGSADVHVLPAEMLFLRFCPDSSLMLQPQILFFIFKEYFLKASSCKNIALLKDGKRSM